MPNMNKLPQQAEDLLQELYQAANLTNKKRLDELKRTLLVHMVPTQTDPIMSVESMVASKSKLPVVAFTWGAMRGELSPVQARGYALQILEACEAATQDAALYDGMVNTLGSDPNDAFRMITLVRDHRRKFEGSES